MKDLNVQMGRIWNKHLHHRLMHKAHPIKGELVIKTAEKIGVPKVYDPHPMGEGEVWWFDHKIFYANYETKVVL